MVKDIPSRAIIIVKFFRQRHHLNNRKVVLPLIKCIINFPIKDQGELPADLVIPDNATALIIFAHGSGSSRTSSRNQTVARILNNSGFGTLLFDLLTKGEQETDSRALNIVGKIPGVILNKFNIELLIQRLDAVTQWIQNNNDTKDLSMGYFGASTGAAAALYAASSFRDVKAVVSRGGRTDLVDKKTLAELSCPCLFIVGSNDKKLIEINKKTIDQLTNVEFKELKVIEDASHLFEEEGKIEEVGNVAARWLKGNME